MDASEIYSKRLNAKEVIFPKEDGKFFFPIADGRIKFAGGDQELRTPTLIREHPNRGESRRDFLGESELSSSTTSRLTFRMPVERLMIFGPCQETSYTAITLNPESNFTRREKNHSPIPPTYPELHERFWMLCKKAVSTAIGISMDQEICRILGQVSLSLLYWKRTDICGPV